MRVLVTGGAGFIGSNLVDRLLAEGYEVDVIDDLSTGSLSNLSDARAHKGSFSFHQIDIRAPEAVDLIARRRPEIVFHLAAQSSVRASVERPFADADVNVAGTIRILEGARAAGTSKVMYAASGGTLYGEPEREELPIPESLGFGPLSPYGASKRAPLDYLAVYRHLYGIEYCALALANVYGARQDPYGEAGVVAIFSERLRKREPLVIFGDGEQTRDFVFVDDAVDAFVRAVGGGEGMVLNVGTGRETTVNEIAERMLRLSATEVEVVHEAARPGELRHNSLDPARAGEVLGWRAWTDLDEGLAAVIGWEENGRSHA